MIDWTDFFSNLSKREPSLSYMGENFSTNFWETLYQSFKFRMMAETNLRENETPEERAEGVDQMVIKK